MTVNVREVQGRDLKKVVQEFVKKNGCPDTRWKIFECSGTAAGQDTAFGLLNHGATLSVVGFTMDKVELRLSNGSLDVDSFGASARSASAAPKRKPAATKKSSRWRWLSPHGKDAEVAPVRMAGVYQW